MAVDLTQYPLIPEDAASTPEEDLAAALASQLDVPTSIVPLADEQVIPLGVTWEFDFEAGQFRVGGDPALVSGFSTLAQWCLMAIHTARYQYPAFDEEFGMEDPGDLIGEFATGEVLADFEAHLTEALLVHDRVSAIENVTLDWDPTIGVLTIEEMDVVTDDGVVPLGNVQVPIGGGQ